jgi:hypothetical protein
MGQRATERGRTGLPRPDALDPPTGGPDVKGIVFNLLEQVVTEEHGEEAWDGLLEAVAVDGAYTALGNYPDEELLRLVGAAASALDQDPDHLVKWFGRRALPILAGRYPEFFKPHEDTWSFLLTLNDVIHPEVRKLLPGADVPIFDVEVDEKGVLALGYRSQRRLCALAAGFIEGAAAQFGQEVAISHPECMKRGDSRCLLLCSIEGEST